MKGPDEIGLVKFSDCVRMYATASALLLGVREATAYAVLE